MPRNALSAAQRRGRAWRQMLGMTRGEQVPIRPNGRPDHDVPRMTLTDFVRAVMPEATMLQNKNSLPNLEASFCFNKRTHLHPAQRASAALRRTRRALQVQVWGCPPTEFQYAMTNSPVRPSFTWSGPRPAGSNFAACTARLKASLSSRPNDFSTGL